MLDRFEERSKPPRDMELKDSPATTASPLGDWDHAPRVLVALSGDGGCDVSRRGGGGGGALPAVPLRRIPTRDTTGLTALEEAEDAPPESGLAARWMLPGVLLLALLAGNEVFPRAHPTPLEVIPVSDGFAAAVQRPWRIEALLGAAAPEPPPVAGRETPVRVTLVPRVADRLRSDDAVLLASLPPRARLLLLPVRGDRESLGPPLLVEDALLPRRGVELRLLTRLPLPVPVVPWPVSGGGGLVGPTTRRAI